LILPLFYKYSEIEDQELKGRIMRFMNERGVKVENIYSINLSKNTKKANAMFCGLGKTKRILLGDTLLEKFDHNEIEVVLANHATNGIDLINFGNMVQVMRISISMQQNGGVCAKNSMVG